jgi:hypothetical protein
MTRRTVRAERYGESLNVSAITVLCYLCVMIHNVKQRPVLMIQSQGVTQTEICEATRLNIQKQVHL